MQYRIIRAESAPNLEKFVTKMLADGWSLQGGISVAIFSTNDTLYSQAMDK